MKRFPFFPLALALLASSLVSCSTVKSTMTNVGAHSRAAMAKVGTSSRAAMAKVGTSSRAAMAKMTTPVKSSFAKLGKSRFKFPSFRKKTPPLVAVQGTAPQGTVPTQAVARKTVTQRAVAKKPKPSKADLLAWNRKKKAASKKTSKTSKEKALVPKDFEPADLEIDGQLPNYGVLPSLDPGDLPPISDLDDSAILPADIANLPEIPSSRIRTQIPDLSSVPEYLKPVGPVPAIKTGE